MNWHFPVSILTNFNWKWILLHGHMGMIFNCPWFPFCFGLSRLHHEGRYPEFNDLESLWSMAGCLEVWISNVRLLAYHSAQNLTQPQLELFLMIKNTFQSWKFFICLNLPTLFMCFGWICYSIVLITTLTLQGIFLDQASESCKLAYLQGIFLWNTRWPQVEHTQKAASLNLSNSVRITIPHYI